MRRVYALLSPLVLAGGCSGGGAAPDAGAADAAVDGAQPDAMARMNLAETGLYEDPKNEILAPGVVAYEPAVELWSDGAEKRRFVYLPDGGTIDTGDMNFWVYPVGTKIWKEFTRDGVRVETRLIWKQGEGDWFYVAFAWNQEQTEALAVPDGAEDVLGTDHDIPSDNDCEKCHLRQPDFVLGLSALQLDHDRGDLTLEDLARDGRLSDPVTGGAPYFPLPGDEVARAALGYLHANCGGCHHARSGVLDKTPLELRLDVESLGTVEETPVYQTAVGVPPEKTGGSTSLIEPGAPGESAVHARMTIRDDKSMMPPLATELVDDDGLAAVDAWITSLASD